MILIKPRPDTVNVEMMLAGKKKYFLTLAIGFEADCANPCRIFLDDGLNRDLP